MASTTPSVSIVIPTVNEEAALPATLAHLRNLEPAPEILVVDGGSTDGTMAVVRAAEGVQGLEVACGRAKQMNAGAQAATGDWLLFLHADTLLPAASYRAALELMRAPAGWGWFDVCFDETHPAYRAHAWLIRRRARLFRNPTGDQGLFVRRDMFDRVGGFPDFPVLEDVALVAALRARAPGCAVGAPVITSARRWRERGLLRTILHMWSMKLQYLAGRDPHAIAAMYPHVR